MKRKILLLTVLLSAMTAWADVEINETNFPDENFRNYLLSQEYGADGVLTEKEIAGITEIRVGLKDIHSLQGIEYFTALTELDCGSNHLKTLNVSKNRVLKQLDCESNELTWLDVSVCTSMEDLKCRYNQLTELILPQNTGLKYLFCNDNQLTELDVSRFIELEKLYCGANHLKTLNVSYNIMLKELNCYSTGLTELDLTQNINLEKLLCHNNHLETLNLSKNKKLKSLCCYRNNIRSLGMDNLVKNLPTVNNGIMYIILNKLEYVDNLDQNEMTTTQVAAAKKRGWTPHYWDYENDKWQEYAGIKGQDVMINETTFPDSVFRNWVLNQEQIKDGVLTVSEQTAFKSVRLNYYNIKSLKGIEYFPALTNLECICNQLTELDVSKNTELTQLVCYWNQIETLDVSKNTKLKTLNCCMNKLTSLVLSEHPELRSLNCQNNLLTTLNVSGCTAMTLLLCYQNQIKNAGMDALVESLPLVSDGNLDIIYNKDEGNVMTFAQVQTARAKGWIPYYKISNNEYIPYIGIDAPTEGMAIDATRFPDVNFRNYLLSQWYGEDGWLSYVEIGVCEEINVSKMDIQSLEGIEYFTALKSLWCDNNQLTSLDVSKNMMLKYLGCGENKLTSLDMSKNTTLVGLGCSYNQLTSLNMSNNTALTWLECDNNQLTSLNVTGCNELKELRCYRNQIRGEAMDKLVESLPYQFIPGGPGGRMFVIWNLGERNEMYKSQVAAAKAKGWTPYYFYIDSSTEKWYGYMGSEDPNGIEGIAADKKVSRIIYNLQGQRINGLQKGLNIVDGKKVMVK